MKKIILVLLFLPFLTFHIVSYSLTNANNQETHRVGRIEAYRVYKLRNSPVILLLGKGKPNESSLFLTKDSGAHWITTPAFNQFSIGNIYLSEKNYIYVIAQKGAGDTFIQLLYESRDEGKSWKVIRQFTLTEKFFCSSGGSKDSLVVTESRVFCGQNYSSKYDSLDANHFIELNV